MRCFHLGADVSGYCDDSCRQVSKTSIVVIQGGFSQRLFQKIRIVVKKRVGPGTLASVKLLQQGQILCQRRGAKKMHYLDDRSTLSVHLSRDVQVFHLGNGEEDVVSQHHTLPEESRDKIVASDGRTEELGAGNRAE